MHYYVIYSISPNEDNSESKRFVECFENKEDAEVVLKALESVNVSFNYYRIDLVEHYTE